MSKSPSSVSRFLPLLALLVAIPPVRAQEAPRFEEEARVVTVEVPVQVVARGEAVRGLTAEDFTILDDGRRRPIEGFEVVDLRTAETGDAGDPGGAAVPPAARRHLLLLFDLSFSDPASIERAREAGHEVVTRGLVPSDRVAVAAYRAAAGVELVLGFTPDHAQVEAAIDGLGTTQPLAHHRDPLALVVADAFDPGHPYKGGGGGGNNKAKRYAIMRDNYRDLNNAAERAIRDHQESDVLRFMASLEEVASLLRDVPGRKQVVLLSEGFDDTLLIGTEDVDRLETMSAEASRGAYWRVDSEERFGSSTVRRGLEMTVESLRRAGCSVQAVDIGGVRTGSIGGLRRQGENGLFALADATGGELLRNHNDLAEALERLLDHQSVTCVLAFAANDVPEDGAFHRLEVKVPGAPGGARVLHQPGYYAPRPYGDLDATERRVRTAGLVIDGRDGGPWRVSALAAPFLVDPSGAYVPVLLEIDGAGLAAGRTGSTSFDVFGYAIAENGAIRGHVSHSVTVDVDRLAESLAVGGLRLWEEMLLPAGRYRLRFVLQETATGEATVLTLPLTVPEPGSPTLLPPFLPDASGSWIVRRAASGAADGVAYPFELADAPFVPAVRPLLTSGSVQPLALVGYHLGNGGAVTASLSGIAGAVTVPVEVSPVPSDPAGDTLRLGAALALPRLQPGLYELTVSVAGTTGTATSSLEVTVVPPA